MYTTVEMVNAASTELVVEGEKVQSSIRGPKVSGFDQAAL